MKFTDLSIDFVLQMQNPLIRQWEVSFRQDGQRQYGIFKAIDGEVSSALEFGYATNDHEDEWENDDSIVHEDDYDELFQLVQHAINEYTGEISGATKTFTCSECNKEFYVPEKYASDTSFCPYCDHVQLI